jgi:hypothetical protein
MGVTNPNNPMSVARAWAEEYDSKLTADKFRHNGCVVVITDEWCTYILRNAFSIMYPVGQWKQTHLAVFTEHQGWFVWDLEDLLHWAEFEE